MTRTQLFGAILAMAISAAAAAQTLSIPPRLTGPGNEAQTSNWRGARRHQIVLDRLLVGSGSRTLNSLVLHGDETAASDGNPIDVTVSLACIGVPTPDRVETTSFAANVGADLATVVTRRRMAIPPGVAPRIALPFDIPFSYVAGMPLLVQIDFEPANVSPVDNFSALLDAHQLPLDYWASVGRTVGTSCHGPGTWNVGTNALNDEFVLRYESSGLQPGNFAGLFVGASDQFYGGMALPQNLSFLGMPGCVLRASMDTVFLRTVVAAATPTVLATSRLVRDPSLLGVTAHMQVMQFEPAANAAGLTFSELRSEQLIGAPEQIVAVHMMGPITPAAPNGIVATADRNRTLVFDLQ